ncbi:MAG: C_GCAxxG_C_C family protein [Prevotella sp.]|nr:C_GCAxxG_C_C family protein [Prevotella sp.]
METRKQIAAEKKRCNSHNCAQAILHTYADIAGISEDEAMNIAGAFGGGMGNMEGTCGALVGAGLVLGLVNKDKAAIEREEGKACFDSPEREQARLKAKAKSMKQMRQIMTKFQERNGATQCKLLKGVGTKVVLRECPLCVSDAAEFLEEQISCG